MIASSISLSARLWAVLIFFKFSIGAKTDLNLSQLVWARDLIVVSARFCSCEENDSLSWTAKWSERDVSSIEAATKNKGNYDI